MSEIQAEIDTFFETLFPNAELREKVWPILAAHVSGENGEKCFTIWLGDGCNGKSTLNHLMQAALGTKAASLSSDCLIKGLDAENTAVLNTAHYVSIEAPAEDELICTDHLKSVIANNAHVHMECTTLPTFDKQDIELAKRIRVIPFAAKIANPEPMGEKIQRWAPHFFARLQSIEHV
jgi:phage/plasmid-associated DNA primase